MTNSGSNNSSNSISTNTTSSSITTIPSGKKSSFARPKSAEPSSPLLRRALSPDRLHPRSAETKCSISPLCTNNSGSNANTLNLHAANAVIGLKKQRNSKNTSVWRNKNQLLSTTESCAAKPFLSNQCEKQGNNNICSKSGNSNTTTSVDETENDSKNQTSQNSGQSQLSSLTLSLPNQELLPIAEEEKDSPSGSKTEQENDPSNGDNSKSN